MKIRIKNKIPIEETSSAGAIVGGAAPIADSATIEDFNNDEKEVSELKGPKLAEVYSSRGIQGFVAVPNVSGEDELAGFLERADHQGLQNVKRENQKNEVEYDNKIREIRKKMLRNLQK